MKANIRLGRLEDLPSIASFTKDTFEWGDYVADAYTGWIEHPKTQVFVAADDTDSAVALVRVKLMSDTEAWLASARVHPSFQRRGLGSELNNRCMRWAREHGALVGRLAVHDWNKSAWSQVLKLGFRHVSSWLSGERTAGGGEPDPSGNGGRRVPSEARFQESSDPGPAYAAWAMGELARTAHGLYPLGWEWRQLRPSDVADAVSSGELWEAPAGWAIAYRWPKSPQRDVEPTLWAPWLVTTEQDSQLLLRALVDHAIDTGFPAVHAMAPAVSWLQEAFEACGYEVTGIRIYEKETARA